ncbi:MAG: aminotransferase class I/II-fold pyridoxal phosphate-dependent enzyme [Alphaproteobacteria bacterium]|nr:aminotransferase class I/II-fold pyridoxal phosphate-dependent enzyme [Alphaproteobacteria bacterium]MCZ6494957.1 aminotransferase class I/II-fold pyridoxal phosphate-dependent enzyme [Alphaproteobacteria bacterium]MCZ6609044.1 aminotransferase class I/II-fold pyridoxal phosphate-dependent enzyme [Alphaproteobacteria bacterium]
MPTAVNDLPAILGGRPLVTLDQERATRWPELTREDEEAVLQIIRDGNISTHPVIHELEADYAKFTGMPYALAHNSGTAALLAAFFALDLEPGDEILVPSATFWASVLPMLWHGIIPIFCESEPDRLGLDPMDVEKKITSRTRAIVVVHLWGLPSKMTELYSIAEKHDLKIIEDASHAHGALWRDKACGSLGDITVFSLQGDKLAPAGEGGIFLARDYEYYERAVCFGDITRIIELKTPAQRFAATSFGIKTRIAPMSAALARVQLRHLPERNRRRNNNLVFLSKHLEALGFHTYLPPEHIHRVYFEYIIRYDHARIPISLPMLVSALEAEGCMIARPRYPLVHQQPFFTEGHALDIARLPPDFAPPKYHAKDLPQTTAANETLIKLPSFPNADRELLEQYVAAFQRVIRHAEAIRTKHLEQKPAE